MFSFIILGLIAFAFCGNYKKTNRFYYSDSEGHVIVYNNTDDKVSYTIKGYENDENPIELEDIERMIYGNNNSLGIFGNDFFNYPSIIYRPFGLYRYNNRVNNNEMEIKRDHVNNNINTNKYNEIAELEKKINLYNQTLKGQVNNKTETTNKITSCHKKINQLDKDLQEAIELLKTKKEGHTSRLYEDIKKYAINLQNEKAKIEKDLEQYQSELKIENSNISKIEKLKQDITDKINALKENLERNNPKETHTESEANKKVYVLTDEELEKFIFNNM